MLQTDGPAVLMPRAIKTRAGCMKILGSDVAFVQTARRPLNIIASARRDGIVFGSTDSLRQLDTAALQSPEAVQLLSVLNMIQPELEAAEKNENVADIVNLLKRLAEPINRFFDTTMVMADLPEVRSARLTLMQATAAQLLVAGDFSKVVIEG